MPEPQIYRCPHCDAEVEATPTEEAVVARCPQCLSDFEIPADPELAPVSPSREDELNAMRIKNISAQRRNLYRTRSYFVIATAACIVTAAQLCYSAVRFMRADGLTRRPIAYFLFAIVALCVSTFFARRAIAVHREAKKPALGQPDAPPDFSTLRDGSQQWKDLEQIR